MYVISVIVFLVLSGIFKIIKGYILEWSFLYVVIVENVLVILEIFIDIIEYI